MRIGIDARFYNESGVGRYIRNLIEQLAVIDTKNTYLVYLLPEEYKGLQLPDRFEKRLADVTWHSVEEQIMFPRILKQDGIDLMHFPYFSVPIRYKGPYVITIHDLILHKYPTGKASTKSKITYYGKWIAYKYIMQQASQNARHILTVSEATKADIVQTLHIPDGKITVTYEGVDQHVMVHDKKPLVAGDYFLHVGNVYPHKNVDVLLDAFVEVLKKNNSAKLVFVGRRDFFFDRLEKKIHTLKITDAVKILGSVTDSELANLYTHARATVIPSLLEGFGLPALEAMAQNCLVIASDIPVMKEICAAAALYCDPRKSSSIARVLADVVSKNPAAFAKQKIAGLVRVKEFSWKEMAKQTLLVYESSNHLRQGK